MRKFHFNLYMITSLFVEELDDVEMMGAVFQTSCQVMKFSCMSQVIARKIRTDWQLVLRALPLLRVCLNLICSKLSFHI